MAKILDKPLSRLLSALFKSRFCAIGGGRARLIINFLLFIAPQVASTQETDHLTLFQTINLAKSASIASRSAATTKETRYWEYRTFQSNFKPQLLLESRLPAFSRSFQEVIQPDGTIQFQPVRNNNANLGLSLEQNIAHTGGTIYATTQVQRFDDFIRNATLYNGTLFAVGLSQPLFRFNDMKWDQKIQPLKYRESQQEYIELMEKIALDASNLYFDLLLAQVNKSIAETNLKNTADIFRITQEKFELGKTSRNEILQLQLEQLKAQKALSTAQRDLEIATLNLRAFIGRQDQGKFELEPPVPGSSPQIAAEKAISEAFANRSDAIAFGRRLLEAQRAVSKAQKDQGVNATLDANIGFSNRGMKVGDLYQKPQNQELITVSFTMPILDWGRAESSLKTAQANQKLTEYTIEQDKQNFRQAIFTQVTLFVMLKEQLVLTAQADTIASEKYQIAQERYVLGNLSITELSIAFSEKDQAKRDYIGALRDYWAAFYQLRWLTLYDFEKQEKITD